MGIEFNPNSGEKKIEIGHGSSNAANSGKVKNNHDLSDALSKYSDKFKDPDDAMKQVLDDPTNKSLLSEALGFIKSTIPEEIPEEEEIFEDAEVEENTHVASEPAIVEGVEVKDPSDAIDKMLKGEISREGAMAYIKSTIPEGDIPEEN